MALTPNQPNKCNTIVCPPICVNNDILVPVPVDVIQPIEIINRYHPVPIYRRHTQVICRDAVPGPGAGPVGPGPVGVASRKKKRK